jgi:hypothetical protein
MNKPVLTAERASENAQVTHFYTCSGVPSEHGGRREWRRDETSASSAPSAYFYSRSVGRSLLLGVALTLLLIFAMVTNATAAGTETIAGKVVDGTAGATLPTGLTVTLQGVGQNHQLTTSQTASVGPDGSFSFANVPADPNITYVVSTEYAGVPYQSALPRASGATTVPVALKIYETTASDAAIRVDSASWLLGALDMGKQQATILALLSVSNDGDRVYVGDRRGDPGSAVPGVLPRTLRISLPRGASDFQPQMGLDPSKLLPVANGFADTAPVLPGKHELAYTYRVGYADGATEISVNLIYPTTKLRFLAPDAGLEFRSDRLGDGGTMQIEGRTYRVLAADNLKADTTVTVDVLGLPAVFSPRLNPQDVQIGGLIVIALGIVLALYLGARSRGPAQGDPLAERRALLAAIAQLDDRYAAGQVNAERYQTERARQKRQLIDLIMGARASHAGSSEA